MAKKKMSPEAESPAEEKIETAPGGVNMPQMPGEEHIDGHPKYEVEAALESLKKAHEVHSKPTLYKAVRSLAEKHKQHLSGVMAHMDDQMKSPSITGLRKTYNKKFGKVE